MGNLARATYANQRMTLSEKLRQSKKSKRNTMIALRGAIHVACFIIHVYSRAFGDASQKTWMSWNTPLFFSARGIVANKVRKKKGKG